MLGGSYARALKRFGFNVCAITKEQSSIDYALKEKIIDDGTTELDERIIGEADIVIFALYPHIFLEWIEKNQEYLELLMAMVERIRQEGIVHKNGALREDPHA